MLLSDNNTFTESEVRVTAWVYTGYVDLVPLTFDLSTFKFSTCNPWAQAAYKKAPFRRFVREKQAKIPKIGEI